MQSSRSLLPVVTAVVLLVFSYTSQAQRHASQRFVTLAQETATSNRDNRQPHASGGKMPAQPGRLAKSAIISNLPLSFEANVGQTDSKVQFISRGSGYTLFLTAAEAVLTLHSGARALRNEKKFGRRFEQERVLKSSRHTAVVRMKLVGSNSDARAAGSQQLSGVANYFVGRNAGRWHTGVPLYSSVQFSEVFPAIDLVYYGKQKQLEYDFVVKPGADPETISLGFEGAKNVSVDASGNVAMTTALGVMKLNKPLVYQTHQGQRKAVDGEFVLRSPNVIGVHVKDYDRTQPLIIDPVLSYSTYLGGSDDDGVYDLAVDPQGNTYVTGWTDSDDFPIQGNSITATPSGTYVSFVAEINPTGTALVYSTYLGGTGGDFGDGIALDQNGYVYLTGDTSSTDFPVTSSNAFQTALGSGAGGNAYVSKLSPDGQTLLYSTYLGGGGFDGGYDIAVDANQNAYLDGLTTSGSPQPFPTTANAFQTVLNSPNGNGFVARIDTTQSGANSLVYSTYFGGSISIPDDWDQACGIAVDSNHNVYLTGMASSSDFPITSTAYETSVNENGSVFLAEINTASYGAAGLVYSTILGGTEASGQGSSVALDSAGKAYITGGVSGNFPTTTSGAGTVLVAKLDTTQSQAASLVYSRLLGGSSDSFSYRVKVDANGDAYVSGWTWSTDFPVTADAVQATLGSSGQDSFVAELSPDASTVLFGTYFGGSGGSDAFAPGLVVDQDGNIYIAGAAPSGDMQTTPGAFQTSLNGSVENGFIAKLSLPSSLVSIAVSPSSTTLTVGATQGFSAVATLGDGTQQDVTASATWASSNNSVVTVTNLVGSQAYPLATGSGSATVTATVGTASGSSSVTVVSPSTPVAPTISGVSPTSGTAGTQVFVNGSGFGATQGSGYVWLGSTLGSVVSWSDSGVVANVATGSTSGIVQVQQNGVSSNSVAFTVSTPSITSVTPTSGVAGTSVTVNGSGFGTAQGSGQIELGSLTGSATSWSDTQVVASVVAGAASGNAQVLQNGVWSNAVPFTISAPQITGISPTSGSVGTAVTISGSGFGATQGSGVVWIGSANGVVVSWSDGQVVANVASGALSGIVRVQQNGNWSNSISFTVSPADGSSPLTIVPTSLAMVIGDTHTIQALNAQGQPVAGLTWASSDSTIVSLSTDDPPILTAVAVGHVTITAGNASADVTVYPGSLPIGTVQWTNPGDGSGVTSIVPAVPSASGVDIFAFENSGNVAAITTDGTTAWTANAGEINVPDFSGGLVEASGSSVQDLSNATGQPNSAYTSPSGNTLFNIVAHIDGTIIVVDGDQVVGINPQTGTAKFNFQLQDSTYSYVNTNSVFCYDSPLPQGGSGGTQTSYPPSVGSLMIGGDGYAYLPYYYFNTVVTYQGYCIGQQGGSLHLRLLRIDTAGNATTINLGDWSSTYSIVAILNPCCTYGIVSRSAPAPNITVGTPVSNADSGVVLSWEADTPAYCAASGPDGDSGCVGESATFSMATTSGASVASGTNLSIPGQTSLLQPVLQLAGGTYVGSVSTQAGNSMVGFGSSGNVNWTTPSYAPLMATSDGGMIAQSSDGLTNATFDANGNATGQMAALPTYSWLDNTYQLGPIERIADSPIYYAPTFAAILGGNNSANGTSVQQQWFPPLASCYDTTLKPPVACPGPRELLYGAASSVTSLMAGPSCTACVTYVFNPINAKYGIYGLPPQISQVNFYQFLRKGASLFDGSRSNFRMDFLNCGGYWFLELGCQYVGTTVSAWMSSNSAVAVTQPAGRLDHLLSFFSPQYICQSTSAGVLNEANIFHESLHGFLLNADDAFLEGVFGVQGPSENISFYLENKALGGGPQYQVSPGGTYSCPN